MRPDGAYDRARLHMAGEALLIVEFGASLTPQINDAVLAFDDYLQDNLVKGLHEIAPTGSSLALHFDPVAVAPEKFRALIDELLETKDWFGVSRRVEPRGWRLPVCYGGKAGPDLAPLAAQLKLPIEELKAAHRSLIQRVYMIGFAPGFLYTGALPKIFNVPRLAELKPMVPAGSVSVAIGQSVISSTAHPTGWHVIGRTPFTNFDLARQPPVTIAAGDKIHFYEIDQAKFDHLQNEARQGLVDVSTTEGSEHELP